MKKAIHLCTIFLVVLSLARSDTRSYCPSKCTCNGALIECSSKDLHQIPELSIIQVWVHSLNFTDNEIQSASMADFTHSHLRSTKELDLSHNSISDVEESSFKYLQNLTYLDISYNFLESVSDHLIEENGYLLEMNLMRNLFNTKAPRLSSKSLKILDLSYCRISYINESHVKNLPNLEVLRLSANTLTHLHNHMFDKLHSLNHMNIAYNYWKCSCETLRLFHHLINSRNITIEKTLQCLHENNIFEEISNLSAPFHNRSFCISKADKKEHKIKTTKIITGNGRQLALSTVPYHNNQVIEEDIESKDNSIIFISTLVGVIVVSLITSVVAWKITTNRKIKPLNHIYSEPSEKLLI